MYRKWTKEEISFLIDNYKEMNNKDLSIKLNRTEWAVYKYLWEHGMERPKEVRYCSCCSNILNRTQKKYCSAVCYHNNRKGKPSYHPFPKGHTFNIGKIPWNKGLSSSNDDRVLGGVHHPQHGKPFTEERKLKISKKVKERFEDPTNHPMYGKEGSFKYLNKNPEFIKKRLNGLIKSPNKPERKLIKIINDNQLPYKFCGNGEFIIGYKNPDFVNVNGEKKIIEVFGTYWHSDKNKHLQWHGTEEGCKSYYCKYGFKTLVIWENELDEPEMVVNKIKQWR